MNAIIEIDESLCTGCRTCIRECIQNQALSGIKHVEPSKIRCSQCFHCFAVCPNKAISISGPKGCALTPDEMFSITPEALETFFAYRRSVRNFQKRPVEREIIEKLVETAQFVPSGGNSHSFEFTVITRDETKFRLKNEFQKIYSGLSVVVNSGFLKACIWLFTSKYNRAFLRDKHYGQNLKDMIDRFKKGDDPIFYHAPAVIVIHSQKVIPTPMEDSVLAGYNIVLMAQALGLGTCFVTLAQKAMNNSTRCKEIIGLTKRDHVYAVVLVGYPEITYHRAAPRVTRAPRWRM